MLPIQKFSVKPRLPSTRKRSDIAADLTDRVTTTYAVSHRLLQANQKMLTPLRTVTDSSFD